MEELIETKIQNQLFEWSKIYLNPSVIDKKLILRLDENGIIRAHGRLKDVRLLHTTIYLSTCYYVTDTK